MIDPATERARAAPDLDPLLGSVLDSRYEIQEVLGSGGMGTVYRARHLGLGAARAIKVMKPELAGRPAFVERFKREARVLEGVRHPHLVAVYDFGRLPDGGWYLVSELLEGETLSARLSRRGRLEEAEASRIALQLAGGLRVAHAHGIIHRDIAPDNVMVVGEGVRARAKLLDFGLAKQLTDEASAGTTAGLLFGKLGYAAPEQMGLLPYDDAPLDGRADVFSLAALLYRMLTGHLPWRSDSLQSYLHDLLIRPEPELWARIRAELDPAWQPVLARALARRREDRTAGADTFRDQVLAAAEGRLTVGPMSAPPVRPLSRPWLPLLALTVTMVELLASFSIPPARDSVAAPADPVVVSGLPAGVHRLRAQRPGYRDMIMDFEVKADQMTSVSLPQPETRPDSPVPKRRPLRPDPSSRPQPGGDVLSVPSIPATEVASPSQVPGVGCVSVVSVPWINVMVDGGAPLPTPVVVSSLPAGVHHLRAQRPGYRDMIMDFEVKADQTTSVSLVPQPTDSSELAAEQPEEVHVSGR